MNSDKAREAARILWTSWESGTRLGALPDDCRPRSMEEGYEIQAMLEELSGSPRVGWKIAATNVTGQKHIGVDGPLAGRLLATKLVRDSEPVPMADNFMRVAEAEFAFVLGRDIPARGQEYTADEVLGCVASLHPAIELPDSRFQDFVTAGGPQLAADNACAGRFLLGEPADARWRATDLAAHTAALSINGKPVSSGRGADVLGSPVLALTWLANSHGPRGCGLGAGEMVTTGVCGKPAPITPGDSVSADFGSLGRVQVRLGN